jgi:1-aminocyclopropane-1-carboxylate deaminase/D-cysteine desulfhydrase-like pyridoxal-dependent ACC family enzyme
VNDDVLARLKRVPRVRLLDGPTPFDDAPRLARAIGLTSLRLKRDDAMGLGLGGNKVRSLEFWLGAAEAAGADTLVVAGGQASNQCRLTAAAAARRGLHCTILYDGARPPQMRGNLRLAELFGAELRFDATQHEAARPAALARACEELQKRGRTPYVIGDAALGALGYVAAMVELDAQARACAPAPRHLFVAGSMGTTEAGILIGNALLGAPFKVHLVSVEYEEAELRRRIAGIATDACRLLGIDAPTLTYGVRMDQRGAGHGVPTPESEAAQVLAGASEALVTETTYTAKTLAGLIAAVADGTVPADDTACFWHTGGTPQALA